MIIDKLDVLILGHRVKEQDNQYEKNNNGELDNGVYNKFVNNTIRNDDDGEKANEEIVQEKTYRNSDDDRDTDYKAQFGRVLGSQKQDRNHPEAVNSLMIDSCLSNYNFVINEETVNKMVNDFGYPRDYVMKCLDENKPNYCTTTYYLMNTDQNF